MTVNGSTMHKSILFCLALGLITGIIAMLSQNREHSHTAREVPAPQTKPKQTQNETDESMQMVIKGRLAEVQECYNTQLKRGFTQTGKLVVKWFVDSHGQSSDFEEEVNELGSTELFDCTTTAIQAWSFPKNQATQIRYTFHMKVLEREKVIEREYSSIE
jgi:hypothetical protein